MLRFYLLRKFFLAKEIIIPYTKKILFLTTAMAMLSGCANNFYTVELMSQNYSSGHKTYGANYQIFFGGLEDVQTQIGILNGQVNEAFAKNKKYVAVTFDDGPHSVYTPDLLDELKNLDVKATFFVLGENIAGNEDIIKRMHDEGHEVGNHSYSHPDLTEMNYGQIEHEISVTNDIIFDIINQKPSLMRPPYGEMNENFKSICKGNGMKIVLWNTDPRDWQDRDAENIKNYLSANTYNGDIIIVHDIYETTVEGVSAAIKELKGLGYEFLTASELLGLKEETEAGEIYFRAYLE